MCWRAPGEHLPGVGLAQRLSDPVSRFRGALLCERQQAGTHFVRRPQ